MAFDPYFTLGVTPDADIDRIKAAYRANVKIMHPDVGGDADAFRSIQRAYDLLSDPVRRKRYDGTGNADEPQLNADAGAFHIVASILQSILADESKDPTRHDIIKVMVATAKAALSQHRAAVAGATKASARIKALAKRFRQKTAGKPNALGDMMASYAAMPDAAILQLELQIKHTERAIEIIEDHEFDFEKVVGEALSPYAAAMRDVNRMHDNLMFDVLAGKRR